MFLQVVVVVVVFCICNDDCNVESVDNIIGRICVRHIFVSKEEK
jgi:hypothetical protein